MTAKQVISRLRSMHNSENVAGMTRFGINPSGTLGVPIPVLRAMAKEIGKNHDLAAELWKSGIHEARLLAGFIDDPACVSEQQMENWVADFDSWDVCDQVCSNLFDRTPYAHAKALEWSARAEEFVKRAGFVMIAALSVHDKKSHDSVFARYLPVIKREADDDRNFVKKAVSWALRQIGKRNAALNAKAIGTAEAIGRKNSRVARWIAADALRELTSDSVRKRLFRG